LAGHNAVDLVPTPRAVLGGEQPPRTVPAESLRVPMAERVYEGAGEGVIRREGAVGVEAQRTAGQRLQPLRQAGRGGVARGPVELAAGPELQAAPVVDGRPRQVVEQHAL